MRKWFIEFVVFPISKIITGINFRLKLEDQRTFSLLSERELQVIQTEKLGRILNHAVSTTKKYANINLSDVDSPVDWLQHFPVINKSELSKNGELFISNKFVTKDLIKYESSGSTGVRSVVFLDKEEQATIRAILINWWEWNGYRIGEPVFQTGMAENRGIFKRIKDILFNTHYMKAFNLREEEIKSHLLTVKHNSKSMLFGYASSLYEIAKVSEKNDLDIKFRLVMSQGDKLFEHYLNKIKEVFGCDVVEDYGLNEGFMVGQKVDLPFYYIYTPSVYVEILDSNNNPVKDGEMGRIVLTKLDGYAMPLIRYDSGDLGVMLPKEEYPEQRRFNFPLLKSVIGRNTDIIETLGGNKLTVHTFTGIFEFFPEITQFQIVVTQFNSLTVRYIPSDNFYPEILVKIEKRVNKLIEENLEFCWEQVDNIEASKSGKPQILINKISSITLSDSN